MICGAKAEATKLGVTLNVGAPTQFAPAQQIPVVDAAIASHPSAIVLVPTDPTALNATAKQIVSGGIKLVTADTNLSQTSGVSTQVLSNNIAGGAEVAVELNHELKGHGQVLLLTSQPGQVTTQDARAQGFVKQLKKYPGLKYVGAQYSTDEPSLTASQVDEELSRYPNLAGIFADNDQSGIGAASGLKAAHKKAGQVKLFVYDSAVSEVQSLTSGIVQGLVAQEPRVEGIDAVQYAVAAAQGKSVPKIVETATKLLTGSSTAAQLAEYEYQGNC
jgi:ribose transport system substrate-binding protein